MTAGYATTSAEPDYATGQPGPRGPRGGGCRVLASRVGSHQPQAEVADGRYPETTARELQTPPGRPDAVSGIGGLPGGARRPAQRADPVGGRAGGPGRRRPGVSATDRPP